jgi:hypothetical protein
LTRGAVGAATGVLAVALACAVCALAFSVRARAAVSAAPRAHAALSSAIQVTQIEYRILLSRGVVKAGPVSLEEIDAGMDPHDLRLRHGRSRAVLAEPLLNPGQRWDGVVDLRPGVYHLWCSLPGHWKLGMRATLRVVR